MDFKNIIYYEKIPSTQSEAWRLYDTSEEEEYLLITHEQTKGRGTHGRVWDMLKGNIAFSYVIRLNNNLNILTNLTYKIAGIIKDILESYYDVKVTIKLPNDLMIDNKKVGGILVESKILEKKVKALVIGVGLNTMMCPKDKDYEAISLFAKVQKKIDNDKLIKIISIKIKEEILERMKEK